MFKKNQSKKNPLYIEYFSRAKEDKKRMNGRKSCSFGRYVEKFCDEIMKPTIFKLPASVEFFKKLFIIFPSYKTLYTTLQTHVIRPLKKLMV